MKKSLPFLLILSALIGTWPFRLAAQEKQDEKVRETLFSEKDAVSESQNETSRSETAPKGLLPFHSPIPWIFIPVNENGDLAGDEYYLPLEMFGQLYRQPLERMKSASHRYFFHSALYSGSLLTNLTSNEVSTDSIRVHYEIEVLLPETEIRFPFSASQIYLAPGSMLLNGEPLQVFWENGFPVVKIAKAGRYFLEFVLVPIVGPQKVSDSENASAKGNASSEPHSISGNRPAAAAEQELRAESSVREESAAEFEKGVARNGFRFEIPPIPNSRLELHVPTALDSVEFPEAVGRQQFDPKSHSWTVQLGAASRLAVQWKIPASQTGKAGTLVADELYSWILGNEGRELQCRYRFRMTEGRISRMEWLMDSRLHFQPENVQVFVWKEGGAFLAPTAFSENPSVRQLVPFTGKKDFQILAEGKNRRVILSLASPVLEPILVTFSMKSPAKGSVGSFFLPFIRTEKNRIMRRWFQIASENSCQFAAQEGQSLSQISVSEFFSVWNDFSPFAEDETFLTSMASAFVLDDTSESSQTQLWMVKSKPNPSISTVQELLSFAFDQNQLQVHYTIRFPSEASIPALFHVQVPENLNVEKVVLHDGFRQKNLRSSRTHLTQIGIFHEKRSNLEEKPDFREESIPLWSLRTPPEMEAAGTKTSGSLPAIGFSGELQSNLPAAAAPASTAAPTSINPAVAAAFPLSTAATQLSSAEEAAQGCQIEILGSMELIPGKDGKIQMPFPNLKILGNSLYPTTRLVNLYRTPKVLVTCRRGKELVDSLNDAGFMTTKNQSPFENVRLVSNFALSPQEEIEGTLLIQPNLPKITLKSRTFLKKPAELTKKAEDATAKFSPETENVPGSAFDDSQNGKNPADLEASGNSNSGGLIPSETNQTTESGTAANSGSGLQSETNSETPAKRPALPQTPELNSAVSSSSHQKREETAQNPQAFLTSESSRWQVAVEMLFTVENGLADEITLEIPGDVTMPFVLDPPMPFELEPISNREILQEVRLEEGKKTSETPEAADAGEKKGKKVPAKKKKTAAKNEESTSGRNAGADPANLARQENLEGEWVRMIIHPQYPIAGQVALRLTGELRENRLESSTPNSLVRLPGIRFPGIFIQKQEVILPVLNPENDQKRYRWLIEGMIPVSDSRLFLTEKLNPESAAPKVDSEPQSDSGFAPVPGLSAGNVPVRLNAPFREWNANGLVKIYQVVEKQFSAQLQMESRELLNPSVESVIHSIFWNSGKEFLGICMLDVQPQKSPTCVLRIPSQMELLELHLDSMPVQSEEVFWNAKSHEFQPLSSPTASMNSSSVSSPVSSLASSPDSSPASPDSPVSAGAAPTTSSKAFPYRFYRISLRSLQLPQRLEVLYHGKTADWQRPSLPGTSLRPFRVSDQIFSLEFPSLVKLSESACEPIQARTGASFFYVPQEARLGLWRGTPPNEVPFPELPSQPSGKKSLPNLPKNASNPAASARSDSRSKNDLANAQKTKSAGAENQPQTHSSAAETPPVPIPARPWIRIQLLCLERLLGIARSVSALQVSGAAAKEEQFHWFENWNLLRFGSERLVSRTLDSFQEPANSENRQNFHALQEDGKRLFADRLSERAVSNEALNAKMEDFRQNSLWLVFIRNLPSETRCLFAFDSGGGSSFFLVESQASAFTWPEFTWAALYSLLFTLMILLGLRFRPAIPEEVRTGPFWLLCVGSLWLLCGLDSRIGLGLMVASILLLTYRIGKLAKNQ